MSAPKVTATREGGEITIAVELPGDGVRTLPGDEWKAIARAVLREYNAAEHELEPAEVLAKIRSSLADAAERGLEPHQRSVGYRRMVSSVLHRLADMIQGGTVDGFEGAWLPDEPGAIELDVISRHGAGTTVRIELGRGLVNVSGAA